MSKYKFKVGDRVQFKTWGEMKKEFGANNEGDIEIGFIKEMKYLCGTQATIDYIHESIIKLKDFTSKGKTDWTYSADMIKPYKPKKSKKKEDKMLIPAPVLDKETKEMIESGAIIIPSLSKCIGLSSVNGEIDLPKEAVKHPSHYNQGNIEVIDYLEDQLSEDEFYGFCIGNVLKYVSRAKHKRETPLEDLKKSKFYLERIIKKLENGNER